MAVSELHDLKGLYPMLVTLWGISTDASSSQSANVLSPITSTPSSIVREVMFSQPENAPYPMLLTLPGIVKEAI